MHLFDIGCVWLLWECHSCPCLLCVVLLRGARGLLQYASPRLPLCRSQSSSPILNPLLLWFLPCTTGITWGSTFPKGSVTRGLSGGANTSTEAHWDTPVISRRFPDLIASSVHGIVSIHASSMLLRNVRCSFCLYKRKVSLLSIFTTSVRVKTELKCLCKVRTSRRSSGHNSINVLFNKSQGQIESSDRFISR